VRWLVIIAVAVIADWVRDREVLRLLETSGKR
jgi:hypothetical protein